jgi:hypothetical protein
MFTPIFGRVKGQTETALFDFAKQNSMFKVYNIRPGGVDWTNHPDIHPFIPKQAMYKRALISPMNMVYKSMMTPTQPMGKIMTELAMSKGEPLQGSDIGMKGTLIPNVAIRRMAGL